MYRTYLMTSAAFTTLLALAIVVFCFVVDPYDLYPSLKGYDREQEVDLFYHLRLHKPYAMESHKAQHLIVGSSRSARLPPALLAGPGEAAYNGALPGVTMREMRLMVEHAQAIQPLKSVVIGIDYYMFRQGQSEITGFEAARLHKTRPTFRQRLARHFQRFEDNWKGLLSTDSLLNAWNALHGKGTSQRHYNEDGTWQANLDNQKNGTWLFSMLVRQKYQDFTRETDQLDMADFATLLQFCDDHDIRALVLISPFHASIMNTVNMAGKWQQYINWQQQVTEIGYSSSGNVSFFAMENSPKLVLESIDSDTRFFQDGVHYTGPAGSRIMACLARGDCDPEIQMVSLGRATRTPYFDALTLLMKNYRHSNPRDFARVQKWLAKSAQEGQ